MTHLRPTRASIWLIVLILILPLTTLAMRSPATLAQDGGVMLTRAGQTTTWNTPWSVDPQRSSGSASGIDILVLRDGTAAIAIVTGPITLGDAARGLILGLFGADTDAATIVDQGTGGGISYWLDVVPMLDGTTVGVFTTAVEAGTGGILTMVLSPIDAFEATMTSAQATIAIDGRTPLDGWTAPATVARTVPSRNAEVPYVEAGMIGPTAWRAPQHGIEVQWDAAWRLDSYLNPPVVSDTESGEDPIHLEQAENDAVCVAVVVDP